MDKPDTRLFKAVNDGDLRKVMALLERGADVNAATKKGNTPFMTAARNGKMEIVKELLDNHSLDLTLRNRSGKTAYDLAVQGGHIDVAEMIIGRMAEMRAALEIGRKAIEKLRVNFKVNRHE